MDHITFNFVLFAFGALIAILNPVGILPQYIVFTAGLDHQEVKAATKKAVLTGGCVLIVSSLIGSFILQFFKITIPAFKIAGGIILFKIALDMIYVKWTQHMMSTREREEGIEKDDVSIFPLAIPLLAGPGSITTVIMLQDKANTLFEHIFLPIALLVCFGFLYLILAQAKTISEYLGRIGINVMTRLMGLILAAIAVQFILGGFEQLKLIA